MNTNSMYTYINVYLVELAWLYNLKTWRLDIGTTLNRAYLDNIWTTYAYLTLIQRWAPI